MAPQRKYGNRPRQDALFRLSPFLRSSPAQRKQELSNVEQLADKVQNIQIQIPLRRKVLEPKDGNERKPIEPLPLKEKPVVEKDDVQDLSRLVKTLNIHATPIPPETTTKSSHFAAPLLDLCSEPAEAPTLFSVWSSDLEPIFDIVKIAEASYGEVYRLVLTAEHPKFTKSDESVLKILALKGPPMAKPSKAQLDREQSMSAVDNVAAEVKLLQRMADIPGFTHFRDIRVLKGKPSQAFAQAWKKFNDSRPDDDKSQFPDPSKRSSYTNQQLWAVIEMQDAGTDLENIQLRNVFAVWDVFWGVTLTLAKGEQEAEFEHRDLHMGNICVKPRKEDERIGAENARINNLHRKIGFTGLETTIIDYTLSRAVIHYTKAGMAEIEYLDLALDPALFQSKGHYQYDIYRHMRDVMGDDPWVNFKPRTNLVWLHFILHEMLTSSHFTWPTSPKKHLPKRKRDPSIHKVFSTAKRITSPKSRRASSNHAHGEKQAKEKELASALQELSTMLRLEFSQEAELVSAVQLVQMAVQKGWLDESDLVGGEGDTSLSLLSK